MSALPVKSNNLYTAFCSGVLFPLHEQLKGHQTIDIRRHMEATQWWPRQRIEALQLDRLKRLLHSAQKNVPYYTRLFAETGFEPDSLTSVAQLAELPFLTKDVIRNNLEELKAKDAIGLAKFNTGGSSGEPLQFFIGKQRVSHDVAAKWRATRWWGVDIGDPEIVVWGSPIELGAQDKVRALRDKLMRTRLLPAFEMSDEKLEAFLEEIRTVRPRMLFGYPSALAHIARYAEAKSIRMDNLGIKVAFVTSERLYDDQHLQIAKTFGCPVANGYGGRDAGFIAHACPHGGMHITAEDIIVEIVSSDGTPVPHGESGEIVITHLATADFPFIRYRTGDMAILDDRSCECGRGLPLIKEIQGRTTDFVTTADGSVMHGLGLIYILRDLPGISHFKIIQESISLTRVQIVSEAPLNASVTETIERGFKARLGKQVEIVIENVAAIAAEKSGKYRYVISKVGAKQTETPLAE